MPLLSIACLSPQGKRSLYRDWSRREKTLRFCRLRTNRRGVIFRQKNPVPSQRNCFGWLGTGFWEHVRQRPLFCL